MDRRRPNQQRKGHSRPPTRLDRTGPGRQTGYVSARSLKSLGEYVVARRGELGLTQEEFARRGGIHVKTLQRVEGGEIGPRAKTFGAIDRAADWEPGSARGVINRGDTPRPREVEASASDPYTIRNDAEQEIMELDDLTVEERWRFVFARRKKHEVDAQPDVARELGRSG